MIVGLGVDIVEIQRVREILARHSQRFKDRVFTPGEQAYCERHRDPAPSFAARFAAKEALFKALGTGWSAGVTWRNVEVVRGSSGAPGLKLTGAAATHGTALGTRQTHLSLSHSSDSAVAIVVLEA